MANVLELTRCSQNKAHDGMLRFNTLGRELIVMVKIVHHAIRYHIVICMSPRLKVN